MPRPLTPRAARKLAARRRRVHAARSLRRASSRPPGVTAARWRAARLAQRRHDDADLARPTDTRAQRRAASRRHALTGRNRGRNAWGIAPDDPAAVLITRGPVSERSGATPVLVLDGARAQLFGSRRALAAALHRASVPGRPRRLALLARLLRAIDHAARRRPPPPPEPCRHRDRMLALRALRSVLTAAPPPRSPGGQHRPSPAAATAPTRPRHPRPTPRPDPGGPARSQRPCPRAPNQPPPCPSC